LFVNGKIDHLGFALRADAASMAWRAGRSRQTFSTAYIESITDAELAKWAAKPRSAIFCCNDMVAMQIWHRLTSAGISVPGRVLLAGFDGDGLGNLVDLTTVAFDGEAVGQSALVAMRRLLQNQHKRPGRRDEKRVVTPVKLHTGNTTRGWE
jgi:DNA-binding LacI/PurR family transcriptional regulator